MSLGISFVAFDEVPVLPVATLMKSFATLCPMFPAPETPTEDEGTRCFAVGPASVAVVIMPAPIPWSDLEGPCSVSQLWPGAAEALKGHQAHVVVTVRGDVGPVDLSALLTGATAAVMDGSETALGVLWCNAGMLVRKNIFMDFTTKILPDGLPTDIWVNFRLQRVGEHTSSGFTVGMEAFGLMEFEAENAAESAPELRKRLKSLADYVLEHGPVIQHGHTIGESASERIKMLHAKSAFGNPGQVMRMEYEKTAAPKPKWKFW